MTWREWIAARQLLTEERFGAPMADLAASKSSGYARSVSAMKRAGQVEE